MTQQTRQVMAPPPPAAGGGSCQIRLAKYVANLAPSTKAERLVAFLRANMLTGIPSRLGAAIASTTLQAAEVARHPLASALDRLIPSPRGVGRQRLFTLEDAIWGTVKGARKGKEAFVRTMQGVPTDASKAWSDMREVSYKNPILNAYVHTISRLAGAIHQPFKYLAMERSVAEQARILATDATGNFDRAAYENLREFPTDEMSLRAIHEGEVAALINQGTLARMAGNFKKPLNQAGGFPMVLGNMLLPFTRVPSNEGAMLFDYSPLGVGRGMMNVSKAFRLATNGDASAAAAARRAGIDQMSRGMIGTTPLVAGYLLASQGLMTGYEPEDPHTAAMWKETGRAPNSIKIGNNWYDVSKVFPLGPLAAMGANVYHMTHGEAGDPLGIAAALGMSVATTMNEQPFLQGLSNVQGALQDPAKAAGRLVGGLAGEFVPSAVTRAAQSLDPNEYETQDGPVPGLDAITSATIRRAGGGPLFPKRVTPLGDVEQHAPGFAQNFLNPFHPSPDRTGSDPLVKELDRVDLAPSRLRQDTKNGETREQFYARRETDGKDLREALTQAIQSEEYQDIDRSLREAARLAPVEWRAEYGRRSVADVATEQQKQYLQTIIRAIRAEQASRRQMSAEAAGAEQ